MDSIKFIFYGLISIQFFFVVWLLLPVKVPGPNGNIIIFELILAGAMIIGAFYLRLRELQEITRN